MKIRIVHLLSQPDQERERRSIEALSELASFAGFEYIQIQNEPYAGELPPAREANDRPFALTPAHYGCYKAHKDAIEQYLTDDIDALLVCECDCVFVESEGPLLWRVFSAFHALIVGNLLAFTFGFKHDGKTIDRVGTDVIVIDQWIETHCYMILPSARTIFLETFAKGWDTIDYCYTIYLVDQAKQRIGTFGDRPVAIQAMGSSLIDEKMKCSEEHYRNLRY